MASWLVHSTSDETIRGHWVMFSDKTLYSQFLSLPRCINGYQFTAGDNPAMD